MKHLLYLHTGITASTIYIRCTLFRSVDFVRFLFEPYTPYFCIVLFFFLYFLPVLAAAPDMFFPLPPPPYSSHKSYAFFLLFNTHSYFLKIHCKYHLYALYNILYCFLHVIPSRRYPLNYYNLCIVLVSLGYFPSIQPLPTIYLSSSSIFLKLPVLAAAPDMPSFFP